jgi:DNA-binding CsgD family transcriptional regulator
MRCVASNDGDRNGLERLSPREREVLEMASLGLTNDQVAGRLSVSVHAVKFHLAGVYRKLGVANRTQATMLLYRSPDARRPILDGDGADMIEGAN